MNKSSDFSVNTGEANAGMSARCPGLAALTWRPQAALAVKLLGMLVALVVLCGAPLRQAAAQTTVNIEAVPLLALKSAPGLVMLTMSRDHRLYYAAYNDTSDLNNDGLVDVGFNPAFTYYGYFVSDRCYKYDTGVTPNRFVPVAVASSTNGCASQATARWHGNWMNWMATSRMDALRKVLYGGQRTTDSTTTTVLEAAHIPPESHIWGKEFRPSPTGTDSYLIQNYTPMSAPTSGKMHIFLMKSEGSASTVYTGLATPTMRAIANVDINIDRVWLWASSERPVGGAAGSTGYSRPGGRVTNPTPTAISYGLPGFSSGTSYSANTFSAFVTPPVIRVEACVAIAGVREAGCTGYPKAAPTIWKPTGVLHDYSTNDQLKFGLLTGSYLNNYSGGVLRKDIGSFSDEIDAATGQFTATVGIAKTIDRLTNYGFNIGDQLYTCGFQWTSLRQQGVCAMWGAPVAEMMYEGLRYFTDKQPTAAFVTGVSGATSPDTRLTLPTKDTWLNPFRPKASGGSPICSRPVQMVIADPITSFDSDQLPGAAYTPATGYGTALPAAVELPGLNVSSEADAIGAVEFPTSQSFFVGQSSATNYDGNPTAKPVTSTTFKNVRGHAPDETTSQGSFHAASVARFARTTGVPIRPTSSSPTVNAKVDTISVALGSVVPRLELTSAGKKVSLVPFSKMVGGCGNPASPTSTPTGFQPTGLITGVFIDRIANSPVVNTEPTINSGRPFARFMVSFSDGDQGGDNEADANAYYTMSVNADGTLTVRMDSYYQATCAQQNMGYVISGTTKDGVYLEVRGVSAGSQVYYLDTRPGQDPTPAGGRIPANGTAISNSNATRTFTLSASTTGASYVPRDPLWYAAKYGGAGVTDAQGNPTNYFKISNPAELPDQMGKAFRSAAALAAVASTSVVGVGQRSLGSAAIYQANYDSLTWSSRLYAFGVATNGDVSNTPTWEASSKIPVPASRTKLFLGRGGSTAPVALTSTGFGSLSAAEQTDFVNASTYAYLLGDKTGEERKGGAFRNRGSTAAADYGSVLGDVVNSDPQIISRKDLDYTLSDATYTAFLTSINFETLAVGTNNGFFHIFDAEPDATGGGELLGFMPQAARANIKYLPDPGYLHQNFVDGAITVGHAKMTVPGDATTNWRTVVVAAGGTGVKTVFAINASSKTFSANSILWEINDASLTASNPTEVAKFGKIMGRPGIGKLANGTWVAIFGNGYNSTAGTANLFVVRLSDGVILKVIPTNALVTGNGMGSTEVVRKASGNRDTIEYVYGSDYKGNIWRFDLSDSNMSNWPSTGALIYTTPTGRPITAEIKVGAAPASPLTTGGKMIYFGTGSYLSAADPATTTVQALYGVYDDLLHTPNTTPFVAEADLTTMTITMPAPVAGVTSDTRTTSSDPATAWYTVAGKKGWVVPLTGTNVTPGERVIAPPVRYTVTGVVDAFLFTSIVPSTDDCEAGLDAWITGVDALTGGYRKVFSSLAANSIRVRGGSPRGVFVLQDNGPPALYISQTIFNDTISTTSYDTSAGGQQTVCINGVCGTTQVLKVDLSKAPTTSSVTRQIWRQLK
ncbi:pilus assembly protein [Polaromonas sp. A23]|uniref:pilus assembly protein n=1 Tax=Polaromonas sp. A23 TaxID=1944133 RepID=UPI00098481FB|nr:PilC/PilY family type IV pilus protein [Polaromonas sp. A23]OOG36937.1 hypothetical protein B0B52_19145 [Polaromonas sp. A23]